MNRKPSLCKRFSEFFAAKQFKPIMFFLVFLGLIVSFPAAAAEYNNGKVRLVLDERTGRFSLYLLSESNQIKATPLFSNQDPRTSFLSVMVNDRPYKMGDTSLFKIHLAGDNTNPSFIFENSFMSVTEDFLFIQGNNSSAANGVSVTITLENRGDRQITTGARFLLDTCLGEGSSGFPITTDLRTINSETLITRSDTDAWWTDKNDKVSLTGSLNTGSSGNSAGDPPGFQDGNPDSVQFANWKKLSDASWKAPYQPGRNFNFPPYSVGDSAVCYYYEPLPLESGAKRSFGFSLLMNDIGAAQTPQGGTNSAAANSSAANSSGASSAAAAPDASNARAQDLAALRELMGRMDAGIAAGSISADDLAAIESALAGLQAKYNSGGSSR